MRQLVLIFTVFLIYTLSLFGVNYSSDLYIFFNLCVVPILLSAYFLSVKKTISVLFCCILLTVTFSYANISLLKMYNTFALFSLTAFFALLIKSAISKSLAKLKELIKYNQSKAEELSVQADNTTVSRRKLEVSVSKISELYYSVKKMGLSVTTEDLILTLRNIMVDLFTFQRCVLITLYDVNGQVKIDKIYNLKKEVIEQLDTVGYEEGLVKVMLRKKQALVVNSLQGKVDAEEFTFPENLSNFISIPIVSGEKTNAVLLAEEPDIKQQDEFQVVANQFAIALERNRLYELVQELAITDGLTKVFVRRHFLERLTDELSRAEHFNTRLALLMIDVDDFKQYNDTYGHLKGDILLKKISSLLKDNIRDIDIIGRYGGEEFCIVLPGTDLKSAEFVANRLRESIEAKKATISIGIATYPDDAKDSLLLIEKADKMLYKAKKSGKNRVCCYEKK